MIHFNPLQHPCRTWARWLVALLALLSLAAPSFAAAPPHSGHAKKPALATGTAFSPDGRLWVVALDERRRLIVQHTQFPGPLSWSPARVLDTGDDEISADGENRPKIAFGPNGWAVITYTQPLAKPYTGAIRMLRSDDGGASFSRPFTVHDDSQIITHRFESVAFDRSGRLWTTWIDKRNLAKSDSKNYLGAAIYRKLSHDGGKSFEPDQKLADHTCECCRIALSQDAQGRMVAAWRHVFPGQVRDHGFAALEAPANDLQRASFDEWRINACPHHGPGLAYAPAQAPLPEGFHFVWFGSRADVPAVRYARLSLEGKPINATVRALPDAAAEHADVAAIGSTVVIVWQSYANGQTSLHAWRSQDGGVNFERQVISRATGDTDHPRLVQSGTQLAVVWRTLEGIEVHDLRP